MIGTGEWLSLDVSPVNNSDSDVFMWEFGRGGKQKNLFSDPKCGLFDTYPYWPNMGVPPLRTIPYSCTTDFDTIPGPVFRGVYSAAILWWQSDSCAPFLHCLPYYSSVCHFFFPLSRCPIGLLFATFYLALCLKESSLLSQISLNHISLFLFSHDQKFTMSSYGWLDLSVTVPLVIRFLNQLFSNLW